MQRLLVLISLVSAAAGAALLPSPARAQQAAPLGGVWSLNRSLSEFPADIGFNPAWMTAATREDGRGTGSSPSGRGRRGSSGGGRESASPFSPRQENYEDARRIQLLTSEARNPPARLTIVDTPAAVTMTNELGQSRTLHPGGKEETIEIQGAPIGVTSHRDGDQFIVTYRLAQERQLRYTYSSSANPSRLVVEVQFLERGTGDKARRVYDPGLTPTPPPTGTGTPPAGSAAPPAGSGTTPAGSGQAAPETLDQRPGAELKGLRSLGVLVEELSPQAIACGLSRDVIEAAVAKQLTDGGFSVRRNSDEDTYVYINIMTSGAAGGLCVSRYDAFLYTHAAAKLSYRDQPVLVQVSLMHRGGIGTSAPTGHGAAVGRGLAGYVDLFVTQIRDANK
jgi:hypothetical protein